MNETWLTGAKPGKQELIEYGVNSFSRNYTFQYKDGIASFFLPGYKKSRQVFLAGTFNNWNVTETPMQNVDSGWIIHVKLLPGKQFYKFIVD